jgi:class 3 adenylate cyclase
MGTSKVPAEAERRQLTVLFCDLVGSTQLSGQLDPEDLRAVVRAYQEAAAAVIRQYAGHIAQYLGDGLLVYFGYPTAHEDDARRAVYAGVGIVEAIGTLNARLMELYGVRLAVRLGIHTGPVVVGVMGGGGRHEQLAVGETPNIAARLESLAPANAVVISAVTARLVRGAFALEDVGTHTLRGTAEPMTITRVRGLLATPSLDEEFVTRAVPVLVGLEEESGLLRRRWNQSQAGLGQVVFVSGDAGIGQVGPGGGAASAGACGGLAAHGLSLFAVSHGQCPLSPDHLPRAPVAICSRRWPRDPADQNWKQGCGPLTSRWSKWSGCSPGCWRSCSRKTGMRR